MRNFIRSRPDLLTKAGQVFLVLSSLAILIYYRRGGVVDSIGGDDAIPGYRDLGIFVNAAEDLFAGRNPYSLNDLSFRSGSFGVLIFGLVPVETFGFIIYQILNLLGFAYFSKVLLRQFISNETLIACLALGIWFSCTREVFSTGQITGILAGLIGFGYSSLISKNQVRRVFGALAFAIALDLKPNLFLFFFLGCYLSLRKLGEIWLPLTFIFCGHLALDLHAGQILEFAWFETLKEVSDPGRDPTSTGTRTLWPIVRYLSDIQQIPTWLPPSLFLCTGITVLILISKKGSSFMLPLALIVPAFYNYFHLYSTFPIAIILIGVCLRFNMPHRLAVLVPFLLVSGASFGILQFIFCLVIGISFLLFISPFLQSLGSAGFVQRFSRVFALTLVSRLTYNYFFEATYMQEILVINCLLFFAAFVFLRISYSTIRTVPLNREG